jgi:hypothetical protein
MTITFEMGQSPLAADPGAFRPDPHAGFAKYRRRAGLLHIGSPVPVVTRYADVTALMSDPRTRQSETEPLELRGVTSGALHAFYANSMLFSNGPVHGKRRAPLARTFAHKLIQAWRPHIAALVGNLLNAVKTDNGDVDFLDAIAAPLPSRLIAEVLGAPPADAPEFAANVYTMSRGLGGFRPSDFAQIERAAADLSTYVKSLLDARRQSPRNDVLTDYLARVRDADHLSEVETLIQIVTLIIAGSDTTRFGLAMLVKLLLENPEQWAAVCDRPRERAPSAVLEALRLEPSVGSIGRVTTEPLEIDGYHVPTGSILILSMLSAQRDETRFADADRFDIERSDHPQWSLAFGLGPHRCLGEALARAELEEALIVLATRWPDLRLVMAPEPKGYTGIRGLTGMRVAIR